MSSSSIGARGKHNQSTFILTCVRKVFSEYTLHGRWLPAEQLRMFMHMKYEIGEEIKFSLGTMMRVINKVLPMMSMDPNVVEIPDGSQLQVFRHSFQNRTRRYFFWVTAKVGVIPSLPSQLNATAWQQDCVLTRLLSGGREQPLTINSCEEEPVPKRQKGLMVDKGSTEDNKGEEESKHHAPSNDTHQPTVSLLLTGNNWWQSGDAR